MRDVAIGHRVVIEAAPMSTWHHKSPITNLPSPYTHLKENIFVLTVYMFCFQLLTDLVLFVICDFVVK